MKLKLPKTYLILLAIILIGGFFRFYKLDWGSGLFTHPDEYHIVGAVDQLSFPTQMNPHFFNYGTVVIYLIYFTKIGLNFLLTITNYPLILNTFLIGRFYSALFSTITIWLVYKICCLLFEKKWALLAAFLTALTPGLIQQAHFATPESLLTCFIMAAVFFLIKFVQFEKFDDLFAASANLALALGVKIVGLLIAPVLILGIIIKFWRKPKRILLLLSFVFINTLAIFYLVAPFVFLDFKAWQDSTTYEGSLATGQTLVFYTRQFINTIPVIFQLEKILPFTLGPILEILGLVGFVMMVVSIAKKFNLKRFLLSSAFLLLFVANGLLFAKWTRFIAPTLPFFSIFAVFLLAKIKTFNKSVYQILLILLVSTTLIWSLAFFSIYLKPDVRITASSWLADNTDPSATFLLEGGNMIDIPLYNVRKTSIDFYSMDENPVTREQIVDGLLTSDYFIIESRRVFMNHLRLPILYPKTYRFYTALLSGSLGFEPIKEFHSFPSLSYLGINLEFPDEDLAEETWSVFDHPVIRIFKKQQNLTREDYEKIVEQ